VIAAIGSALAFLALTALVVPADRPLELDVRVATWIAANRIDAVTWTLRILTYLGSILVIVPLSILVAAYFARRRDWRSIRWLALAAAGGILAYVPFKLAIERARPPIELRAIPEWGWSYPSGHSTQAAAFWLVLAILVTAPGSRGRRTATIAAVLVTLVVGGSRIYFDVHWTTDVLGGFLLGGSWACALLAMRRRSLPPIEAPS